MTIGEKIKSLRIQSNLTQEELANYANTTKQTIHKYETGIITNIPANKIKAISEKLGTTPAYLMGWEDNKSEQKETPYANSDETLMFALYGGDNKDITPGMLEDVRTFAQYIREKRKGENK